jgi:RND family efflux transporter MFP subunit
MSENKPTRLYFAGIAGVILAGVGVAAIWNARMATASAESEQRKAEVGAGPTVRLAKATQSPPMRRLELQGEARPFLSVTLYAKVSGYLKEVRVDKGDRVRANQIVAVIESPEIDRQYDAALADANYKRAEAKRAASLAGPGVVSAREAELEESQAHVSEAQLAATGTQKAYETLRAPFDGTVTARFADPGALLQSATAAQTSALPVVTVSQTAKLRVYVYVDQREAAYVHPGDAAEVRVPERPDVTKKAQVARLATELDPRTRMMLVEVDLDNKDGAIVAGSFVDVMLSVKTPPRVELPVEALVLSAGAPRVAVVKDGVVHFRPVVVLSDDGRTARLGSGVEPGEEVALDLGDTVADGARVRPLAEGHAGTK